VAAGGAQPTWAGLGLNEQISGAIEQLISKVATSHLRAKALVFELALKCDYGNFT
jgi:hypothetical protein